MKEFANHGASTSGTAFVSFLTVSDREKLAREIGFKEIQIISAKDITNRYFKDRPDHLMSSSGEFFLIAKI